MEPLEAASTGGRRNNRGIETGTDPQDSYAEGFEEDHGRRSRFIRELTLRQIEGNCIPFPAHSPDRESIPRNLVRYWHDPNNLPIDVQECLDTWDRLRDEGFSVQMFCDATAYSFIEQRFGAREVVAFSRCRHPAMRSDYLRMCYVLAEGGLYVDADDVLVGEGWQALFNVGTLKVQPLCYDVKVRGMVAAPELKRVNLPTDDRIFYVNNNPIAAPPGHPVLRRALDRATERLLGDEPAPEIQSTTGPGNLTASLAAHANERQRDRPPDYEFLLDWHATAEPCWELSYRNDSRNWRNMDRD